MSGGRFTEPADGVEPIGEVDEAHTAQEDGAEAPLPPSKEEKHS
jgi:hypothetical protein